MTSLSTKRSYHLIATACKDKKVRIFRLTEETDKEKFKVNLVGSFPDHENEVFYSLLPLSLHLLSLN